MSLQLYQNDRHPRTQQREDTPLYLLHSFNDLYSDRGFDVREAIYQYGDSHQIRGYVGIKNAKLSSPFSAPFGGFWPVSQAVPMEAYLGLGESMIAWCLEQGIVQMTLVLPPVCYCQEICEPQAEGLEQSGFRPTYTDINHHLNLHAGDFEQGLNRGARRSLRIAESEGLEFVKASDVDARRRSFHVIQLNRIQKGYPLRLNFDQLEAVAGIAAVDYFLVTHAGADVAAAIVYQVSSEVVQVIYWGNDVTCQSLNAIHFLAFNLHAHYRDEFRILDIGPSSIEGVVDEGLARFKASIGCVESAKQVLEFKQ